MFVRVAQVDWLRVVGVHQRNHAGHKVAHILERSVRGYIVWGHQRYHAGHTVAHILERSVRSYIGVLFPPSLSHYLVHYYNLNLIVFRF